jgi:hypothetical protein
MHLRFAAHWRGQSLIGAAARVQRIEPTDTAPSRKPINRMTIGRTGWLRRPACNSLTTFVLDQRPSAEKTEDGMVTRKHHAVLRRSGKSSPYLYEASARSEKRTRER